MGLQRQNIEQKNKRILGCGKLYLWINLRSGYYQTEWPRRTRAYEYGVYTDQVLQNFFMPGMYVLTNLSPA